MDTAIMINERTAHLVAAHIATLPGIVDAMARRHYRRGEMQGYTVAAVPTEGPAYTVTESQLEAYYA